MVSLPWASGGTVAADTWSGEARFTSVDRYTLMEICEALGLNPSQVDSIYLDASQVVVTGWNFKPGNQEAGWAEGEREVLRLPVHDG